MLEAWWGYRSAWHTRLGSTLRQVRRFYRLVPHSVYLLLVAELMIGLVPTGFLLYFNLLLLENGYADATVGTLVSFRYLGVLASAVGMTVWLRSQPVSPLLRLGGMAAPMMSLVVLWVAGQPSDWRANLGLGTALFLQGWLTNIAQVLTLPYILRSCPRALQPQLIAVHYAGQPLGTLFVGLVGQLSLPSVPLITLLVVLCVVGLCGGLLLWWVPEPPSPRRRATASTVSRSAHQSVAAGYQAYIWAFLPACCLAIGAGLTIPFLNLFFAQVFRLSAADYSAVSAWASVLVFMGMLITPSVRRRYGYRVAVLWVQSVACGLLFAMAWLEPFAHQPWALPVAVACLLLRNPLMNMASPVTSELVIRYLGPARQETVSTLTSSVWSGAWFISGLLFGFFRSLNWPYALIFSCTGVLYIAGILAYAHLIRLIETERAVVSKNHPLQSLGSSDSKLNSE
jgi:hypothetical protein